MPRPVPFAIACVALPLALLSACGGLSAAREPDALGQPPRYAVTVRLRNHAFAVGRCDLKARWIEDGKARTATVVGGEYVAPYQTRAGVLVFPGWVPVTFVSECAAPNVHGVALATSEVTKTLTKDCMVDTAYRITRGSVPDTYTSAVLYVSDC